MSRQQIREQGFAFITLLAPTSKKLSVLSEYEEKEEGEPEKDKPKPTHLRVLSLGN